MQPFPSACWSGLSGTDFGLAMQAGVRLGLEGGKKVGDCRWEGEKTKKVRCLNS